MQNEHCETKTERLYLKSKNMKEIGRISKEAETICGRITGGIKQTNKQKQINEIHFKNE